MGSVIEELRTELSNDEYYKKCALCGHRPVQFHHNLIYGGRKVEEKFAILPLCKRHHDEVTPHNPQFHRTTKEVVDKIMLQRASYEELLKYSKVKDLVKEKYAISVDR